METGVETLLSSCPACEKPIQVRKVWTKGGMNDKGGFALECSGCGHKYLLHVGKDVNDSSVSSGAKLLDRYDDEISGHKEMVAKRHGIEIE